MVKEADIYDRNQYHSGFHRFLLAEYFSREVLLFKRDFQTIRNNRGEILTPGNLSATEI